MLKHTTQDIFHEAVEYIRSANNYSHCYADMDGGETYYVKIQGKPKCAAELRPKEHIHGATTPEDYLVEETLLKKFGHNITF